MVLGLPHRHRLHRRGGIEMRVLFSKVRNFLTVDDPKQTKVNFALAGIIATWIALGAAVNILGQVWYYWVTVPNANLNHASMFDWFLQLMPDVGLAAEKAYIIVITALVTVIGIMAKVIVVLYRDNKEKTKSFEDTVRALEVPMTRIATLIENS
jgi:hypothetical protein